MDALVLRETDELDFYSFDELADFLDEESQERDALTHPLADDLVPYRGERVVAYAGTPGAYVSCPGCGIGGKRVGEWGGYFCEACGYANTEERPVRNRNRRSHRLH